MVTFYKLNDSGMPEVPVLYLDTLKVSTIEQTAEEADARGGKGNAALISWDYGKEITVTLEDALFSAKSLAIMFGNGSVHEFDSSDVTNENATAESKLIMKTLQFIFNDELASTWEGPDGKIRDMINPKYYSATGEVINAEDKSYTHEDEKKTLAKGERYLCTFDIAGKGAVIEVSANSFPGTYYVVGDTFARSEASGEDEMFQFIIPKAKVTSENTITMEADGDPSVFNMNLKVLRPADGKMMKLVKYELAGKASAAEDTFVMVHNHVMESATVSENTEAQG